MKKIITKIISVILLNLLVIIAFGQNLPISLTPQEKLLMHDYYFNNNSKGYNYPPFSKVRSAAEWEEIDALIVTWTTYTPVLREIVRNAVNECKVYVVCSDSASVISYLTAGNVSLTNVRYIIAPYNSVWVRDYSANNVYTNDVDSLLLVDWTYNRPRPKDDTLARTLNRYTGIPLYEMTQSPNTLVATGGNFMSDGMGTAFSSKLILNENASGGGYNQNLSEAQIDTLAKKYLGIHRYIMFETLPYDGIHHIDMHTKLLNENTIIFGQYPAGTADGPQIEANLQYMLSNYNSEFGTPYKVIRIPMPPDPASSNQYPPNGSYLTYTNGVFVNKTFLYPTYYAQYDTVVQKIYEKALPGYNVVGINCNSTISASGAIHCITHCIASNDPLLIVHEAVKDTLQSNPSFITIKAFIKHKSGIQQPKLFYKVSTWKSDSVVMLPVPGEPDYYQANIPFMLPVKNFFVKYDYYISAKANSGKTQRRPITAPTGTYSFVVNTPGNINELTNNNFVKLGDIFPNPASAITCIPVETSKETEASIELFDIIGQKIITIFDGIIPKGNKNYFIDAAKLSKGIYVVKLQTKENSISQKLIVK
ncbi:MAG: agmatine deiminase family protein [Bacteroidetes bacterium]|nr:agmatine deiminase family protein [Bacteroidota bacterium]